MCRTIRDLPCGLYPSGSEPKPSSSTPNPTLLRYPRPPGLVRLTQLKRLEQLELFGEELQLDAELLALLARLPALRRLAMAGLDALRAENMDTSAGLAPGQAAALGAGLQCGLDLREAGVEMGAGAGGAGGAGVPGRPAAGMGVGQPDGEGTEGDADMTTSTGECRFMAWGCRQDKVGAHGLPAALQAVAWAHFCW